MKIFDLHFSKPWSFLFPETCLTQRRLSDSFVFFEFVPKLFASGFTGTVFLFKKPMLLSLARRNPIVVHFHNSHSVLVFAFSSFVGIVAFVWLFVWLFVNLMMREQTLISSFTSRVFFVELALGKMLIFTRRSRASTFHLISARLSKNGTTFTFASRHTWAS